MNDLLDAMSDETPEVTLAPTPTPAAPELPVTPAAPATPEQPAPEAGAAVPSAEQQPFKRLPALAKPAADAKGDKGGAKGKAKGKTPEVSHEDCERFASIVGPVINKALNVIAVTFQSPIRADNVDPKSPHNGLVTGIKFPPRPTTAKQAANVAAATEELKSSFAGMFVATSPGDLVGYHTARVVPAIAQFDQWLKEHPWITLAGVCLATTAQFTFKVNATAGSAPSSSDIGVTDENGEPK